MPKQFYWRFLVNKKALGIKAFMKLTPEPFYLFISQVKDNWQWLPEQMVNINFKWTDFYQYSRS